MHDLMITIEAARVNAHLSQKKAAKLLGISPVTLRSYEQKKASPELDLAVRMAELYKWPVNHIDFIRC